ncbi:MAG TPA: AAA family ATPase [Bacteroidota bacterium]|nr:AAA family ATPase [Bacteroidota bacterium]
MFHRLVNPLRTSSFFLFGPRGTGKTTFLNGFFDPNTAVYIDLLRLDEEDAFLRNPAELEQRVKGLASDVEWVVIDEIQRIPRLLDSVHRLIELSPIKFALTGSSGRKLKRGASNLLAGRAYVNHLHPLTLGELGTEVPITEIMQWGSLPKSVNVTTSREKQEYLRSYAHTYLHEEIAAEQVVRKLDPFRNFLEIAAQCNGTPINMTKIGRDVGADVKTVQSYFTILEDTMMGFLLPVWHRSIRKRQIAHPKFYFFDPGIKRALDRTLTQEIYDGSYSFGNAFEHIVILELLRLNDYFRCDYRFSFLRTAGGVEVDLVIDRPGKPVAFVEIKSSMNITENDCATLNTMIADVPDSAPYCISRDPHRKKIGEVMCVPYMEAARELGCGA